MLKEYPGYAHNKYRSSSFYLIPLEAWRRGLTVTFSCDIKNYSIQSPERCLVFRRSMVLDADWGLQTLQITRNKNDTKKYLRGADIPVPEGMRFRAENTDETIVSYSEQIGFPVVLKPTDGSMGIGVFSSIPDKMTLKSNLDYVRRKLNYEDVIVEERIEGLDYRIFVLGNQVLAALKRMPANITGNGEDTIKELIRKKNLLRAKNPHFARKTIKVDSEVLHHVKRAGYHMNSILRENELLLLRNNGNISTGGDSIDVTDELPRHVQNTATQAVKAIPGLKHAGVDLLFDDTRPDSPAVVIEINSMAEIGGHLYPGIGKDRDIPSALIDHYFPESTVTKQNHRMVFFDPYNLKKRLMQNAKTEITLPPLPPEEMDRKDIMVTGRVQGVGFRQWVRKQAVALDLSGYVENQGRTGVHIVVAGDKERVKEFSELCKTGPPRAKIDNVSLGASEKAIVTGFRIISQENKLLNTFRKLPRAIVRKVKKLKNRLT